MLTIFTRLYPRRVAYGDQFYGTEPEKGVPQFFPNVHLKTFRKAIQKAQSALEAVDMEEQREKAAALGHLDARQGIFSSSQLLSSVCNWLGLQRDAMTRMP